MSNINSYPAQPTAPLRLVVGIHTKMRLDSVRYQPTITGTESFIINSSLDKWETDFNTTATPIWNYTLSERALNKDVYVHYTLRIENVTAPVPSAGSWRQAKANFDGALSDGEFDSIDRLRDTISNRLQNIQTLAKY